MTQHIGRYEIEAKIGQGSMAYVFKAFDPKIQRSLAIKILREDRIKDAEYRASFLRESKAAGQLTHPGIVTIYDVGEIKNHPYMAVELLDGHTLEEALKGKRLPVTTIVQIGMQLADALDYAHKKGVIHRDIKPENIFWQKETNTVKITDFGIAHLEGSYTSDQEPSSMVAGTPEYMSPEQALGQPLDSRSDLYSVGVILFRMLDGNLPFSASKLGELIQKIVHNKTPFIAKGDQSIPNELRQIINKLLKKQPDQRYQSGAVLANELREVLADLKPKAKSEEVRILPLRVKWAMGMALSITLTMAISLAIVYFKQIQSMTGLVYDYGGSLAKILSANTAEALLLDDYVALQTLLEEMSNNKELAYIKVVDRRNIIRADTTPDNIGIEYKRQEIDDVIEMRNGTMIREATSANGTLLYDFETIVFYQGKPVGKVRLGLSRTPLSKAAETTLIMMMILMVVTIASVVATTFVMAQKLSNPITTAKRALNRVEQGEYDTRIIIDRNDEFAHLYIAFNRMADSIETMHCDDDYDQDIDSQT